MAASGVYAATAARSARPIPEARLVDPNGRLYGGLLSFPGCRDGGAALFVPCRPHYTLVVDLGVHLI